ncbi:MAG: aldo/keto reductase [Treponema sp.]|nr:aldo/keto reductase [Treponema sp.]
MQYREYGKTGKKVSMLGFGGMRFGEIDNHEKCVEMMVTAAKNGVNYFDTAPGYAGTKSETVFGLGFAELRRLGLPYYCATKTFKTTEKDLRIEIEAQLKRLNIDSIDFYHVWSLKSPQDWHSRKQDNVLRTFAKLKEEGLIKHICASSHMERNDIEELLMEGVFEGILFGYSAYNYRTREAAFNAIRAKKIGAVVMNPLGGGIIPQHPELFGFLKKGNEDIVSAALAFLWDHQDITSALVGFKDLAQVNEALKAVDLYKPRTAKELQAVMGGSSASMEGLCTGCNYCKDCPQEIPIPKYMDSYNQLLLKKNGTFEEVSNRLRWHWDLDTKKAAECTACGLCEKACTQHINIIERLEKIASQKAE